MNNYTIPESNISISERLYSHLVALKPKMNDQGTQFVPVIAWLPLKKEIAGNTHTWSLYFLEAAAVDQPSLVHCADLLISIDREDRGKLNGKIIDFLDRQLCVLDA